VSASIQVLGQGAEDISNWDEPHSWGLFVFACPSQQGTGANCYGSVTNPGPVSVRIIVRQKGMADANIALTLQAIARGAGSGNTGTIAHVQVLQNLGQEEQRDASGHVVREAATIHVVACNGADINGRQVYIYEYQKRRAFRAIEPPDWSHPLGGRDFATYDEALRAACGGTPTCDMGADGLGTQWSVNEWGHAATWTRRGNGNVFAGSFIGGTVTASVAISRSGNNVTATRTNSSDGNDCTYTGSIDASGRNVGGTFTCNRHATNAPWSATIMCQ
jgi:hypothetical protein